MSLAWRITTTALAAACAVAVSVASVEAQSTRKKTLKRGSQQTYQQSFGSPPVSGGPYNRYNVSPGGGINFNDGRLGANYNGGG